ncbi:PREDICTED: uncharacterized protein LOC107194997 [Dufourea novaeangliae]|uniref:Uncharacterized protein n=1 Tax=Dufourea novaeangliae TaxID=178035 RepID=A0A154P4B3_DUFNO|nr:PREDICTED: uncharacterized protein LOC107194997 [Dufourea novaeangliae]KZC06672.1 hypothetical protein WN55_10583 [Dufourea novaeangliae]
MRNLTCVSRSGSVFLILFIACFSVVLSAVPEDRSLYRYPKFDFGQFDRDTLPEYVPDRWRAAPSQKLQPPGIEIQVLKGHVSPQNENLAISIEYKISYQNYKPTNMESLDHNRSGNKIDDNVGENEIGRNDENVVNISKNSKSPQLDSRTIIDPPSYDCPPGQRKDPTGRCRDIIS